MRRNGGTGDMEPRKIVSLDSLKKLAGQAEKTFVFANNHWQSQAVGTARQLGMLLEH